VRLWMAALGGESVYEADLPACCQRAASGGEPSFECPSCGAMWQEPLPVEPEGDAFVRVSERERRGAA
jgi:tRNA(Ile2) C34 agmatinyltransferase TiaS